jgi:hypothetical protein
MGNVGSLEHNRLGSKFVQIGRVNFSASVAGDRVRSLLIRQKEDQVRFSLRGHGIERSRTKSALVAGCNGRAGGKLTAFRLGNRPIGNFWRRNICNSNVSWFARNAF